MNQHLEKFKFWYEERDNREKFLILFLSWILLYAFFYFTFFKSLDTKQNTLSAEIKTAQEKIDFTNKRIGILNAMTKSPNYLAWVKQRKAMMNTQAEYKNLLKNNNSNQWEAVISTVLNTPANIKIEQIKNQPENLYSPSSSSGLTTKIFQQQLSIELNANYLNTLDYLIQLEKALPNIHWDNLKYDVTTYPSGKVTLEFSIFYEKQN